MLIVLSAWAASAVRGVLLLLLGLLSALNVYGQRATENDGEHSYEPTSEVVQTDTRMELLLQPLRAYPGIFSETSQYHFSFVRYRRRGYDFRQQGFSLDGFDLTDRVTGNPHWGVLSALQNSPIGAYHTDGLRGTESVFGAVGGVMDFDPESFRGVRRSWMKAIVSDRRFRGGAQAGTSSGWLPGGWSLSTAVTRKWGRDRYIRGVYTDDWFLYGSLAKRLGDAHQLSFTYLQAWNDDGVRGASTREAFRLTGDPLYNPHWGYQQGRVRSSRVRENKQPLGTIGWLYTPNSRLRVKLSLAYLSGVSAYSRVESLGAENPTPDYYRNMPGFYAQPQVLNALEEAWERQDPTVTQIHWEELYRVNGMKEDRTAAYVVGSDVNCFSHGWGNAQVSYDLAPGSRLYGGVSFRDEKTRQYRRLDDLLGADYLRDIDYYLIDDEYYGDRLHNDLRHPDKEVRRGGRYGYNHDLRVRTQGAWGGWNLQGRGALQGADGYVGMKLDRVEMCRRGHYEKEMFPGEASLGRSRTLSMTDYMIKVAVGYSFSPRHHLSLDGAVGEQVPPGEQLWLWPDDQNRMISQPRTVSIVSGELGYQSRLGICQLQVSGYATRTDHEGEVRHYYDDLEGEYSAMELREMEKLYAGVEMGLRLDFTHRWSLAVAVACMKNSYRNNPPIRITTQKEGRVVIDGTPAYVKGYSLGGSPQRVAAAELSYRGVGMWYVSLSANYVGDHYVTMNPIWRTRRVYDWVQSPELKRELISQERLPDGVTLDLFVSKTFRWRERYLSVNGSIHNLTDRRTIVQSGYEPMRLLKKGVGVNRTYAPAASRYYYAYGRTYYMTVSFRF